MYIEDCNSLYEKIYSCLHVSHSYDFLLTACGNYTHTASCRAQGKLHFFRLLSVDYDFAGVLCQCLTNSVAIAKDSGESSRILLQCHSVWPGIILILWTSI